MLGCAQTGGGKTAAFALPLMQRLMKEHKPGVRALVLVPSRELAAQVETAFRDCGRFSPFKFAMVIGGVGYFEQRKALAGGAQIVVATPGRLQDHMRQGSVRLDRIEILVLDEADRMLDMGFLPTIKDILAKLPKEKQTLLFSATLGPEIQKIASFTLKNPKRVEISRPTTVAAGITQMVYPVPQDRKTDLLAALLGVAGLRSGVVFTRTKHGADRLAKRMIERGFSIGVLHSGRTQGQRTAAMEDFRKGKTQVLIATDIAARGIDVQRGSSTSHVVNFDVPAPSGGLRPPRGPHRARSRRGRRHDLDVPRRGAVPARHREVRRRHLPPRGPAGLSRRAAAAAPRGAFPKPHSFGGAEKAFTATRDTPGKAGPPR